MKREKKIWIGVGLLTAFAAWTVLVRAVDVQPIGPRGSSVGFASLNRQVYEATGVNFALYTVTDWLGLVPIGVAFGFALLGLIQWIQRKHFLRVDRSILALGGFYLAVMATFTFFETVVINYRPVLIEGVLEASYPSSTTMLVMCVMPTAAMQLKSRINGLVVRKCICIAIWTFTFLMVVGRLFSGVHWISDIIGGMLLSGGLVTVYVGIAEPR
jgi:undecaprenyl-diphosphatase